MIWAFCVMVALTNAEHGAAEATDWLKPPTWAGNLWGPAAMRARLTGQLPPFPTSASMTRCRTWGKNRLHDGDIVFRLGDARAMRGTFPLSRFIANATSSPFSHTGIVAVEDGSPVVYDCSSAGVQRQPFEVWMLDCIGAMGIKRLKPEHRHLVPGVINDCRSKFEQQVPFDYEFRPDDAALYCVELTEKAFRSQGLVLSQPVRIGDWEHLYRYTLTALATPFVTSLILDRPITLEQPVYLPGNEREGIWASSLLETVFGPYPKSEQGADHSGDRSPSLRGDVELAVFAVTELRRLCVDPQIPAGISIAHVDSGKDRPPVTPAIGTDDDVQR